MEQFTHYVIYHTHKVNDSNNITFYCNIYRLLPDQQVPYADFVGTFKQCIMWVEEELNIHLEGYEEQDILTFSVTN